MTRPLIVIAVADTHLPRFGRRLPAPLADALAAADLVLHAGDFTAPWVPDLFESVAPLVAVAGNNDGPELHDRYGTRRIVEAGGVRIGLVHGHLGRGRTTPDRARASFADEAVTAVVFGHSHMPLISRLADRWLLNPGSPTDKRREPTYSFLRLVIADGRIEPQLVRYPERG